MWWIFIGPWCHVLVSHWLIRHHVLTSDWLFMTPWTGVYRLFFCTKDQLVLDLPSVRRSGNLCDMVMD